MMVEVMADCVATQLSAKRFKPPAAHRSVFAQLQIYWAKESKTQSDQFMVAPLSACIPQNGAQSLEIDWSLQCEFQLIQLWKNSPRA
jgi:hypothetical protein